MTHPEASETEKNSPSELVRRILAGDRDAEEELVGRYSRGVSILIGRIVRNACTTEDLCQEAFRLILEKVRRGDVREPERLSGFICSLARNVAIEDLRKARRAMPVDDVETSSISDLAPDQLGQLLRKEKANAVRQVLRELSSVRDREVLYRYYIAEEDKDQICADLELSALHFNCVLHRARERFRQLYQKSGGVL
jgi:RNA polymerase sigma-70 factor (ECF subfamily)